MRKLNKLMVANSERLVGMIGQFDEGDKEYLTQPELVAFIDFFLEESKKEVTEEAAKVRLQSFLQSDLELMLRHLSKM